MDASQKFLEEIEFLIQDDVSHYEYEDDVAEALRDMPEDYSIPIIVLLECNIPAAH